MNTDPGILTFEEGYFERIWGGTKLESVLGKTVPGAGPIGEAWLLADHPQHESVVAAGPHAGRTLRDLLEEDAASILGSNASLTIHGRFPLLLKILDSAAPLSVQVHPDDDDAKRLNEPDVGKTEMWHVLEAEAGSELICGLDTSLTREDFQKAVDEGDVAAQLPRFPVSEGTSVFVPAGTVHAVGQGILLAEIQQNSDITYRVYDWDRLQDDGTPRQLHVERSLQAIHFGSRHGGAAKPLRCGKGASQRTVLAACKYFSAELVNLDGEHRRETGRTSFHLLLGKSGTISVAAGASEAVAGPGEAVLVPGSCLSYEVQGRGEFLVYYVPDLKRDIVEPLLAQGHAPEAIIALGGDPATSDIRI